MMYLHDVWVNWFEGEENGYNVYHFHEWRKGDGIELLDQVPLLYVEDKLFNYIENDMSDLPQGMLDTIYKRAYSRKGNDRTMMDYAAVVTNGNDIIAFDTLGYQLPIRKSRLIPRQEQLVYEMIVDKEVSKYEVGNTSKEYHILSLEPKYMYGLTRTERKLKEILMMALDTIGQRNDLHEMKYWLTEMKPNENWINYDMDNEEVFSALFEAMANGWSEMHMDVCRKIIKGQPFLEKLFEIECRYIGDKDKLAK